MHRTPCKQSATLNRLTGKSIDLKLENLQKTGSFKVRGAYNKISQLPDSACSGGIIAASAGNHAQGVALAGRARGVPVTVFMPETTPQAKVTATRQYGAAVKLTGSGFDEAYAAAREEQAVTGAVFVHPFDDPAIIEGQATVALEMLQQCPDLDTLLVPAGGGGLLAGTAIAVKALRPSVRVIGIQTESAPAIASLFRSIPPIIPGGPAIAEGIMVKTPGKLTTDIISSLVDDVWTVTEREISSAILFMLEREKMLVEGAGAATTAAALHGYLPASARKVGAIVSGGNLDVSRLAECRELSAGVAVG
ncbi:threonine/serine dehydratase [Indiicoccus explosivorum]|uniref:threonine ammonia-lyase n=1 Tax=Indiicoccus explosivorum TaxID=1917864 RepID=UPI0030C74885